jgi:hypothetical protein
MGFFFTSKLSLGKSIFGKIVLLEIILRDFYLFFGVGLVVVGGEQISVC